ncbi:MAG: cysteine hydrolase [Candidatus Lustribacter sp.]|jgi:nicotinamidase-related amidase
MKNLLVRLGALVALLASSLVPASADIVGDWTTIKTPAPPALKPVTIDRTTTALLVLDFVDRICNFPECTSGAVPNVAKLIAAARAAHVPVIYSEVGGTTAANILPAVAPQSGEPIVSAHADKFIGTNLQELLDQKGIKNVIVTGVAANGAALYTASHAAFLGYKVVFPVDAIAAPDRFADLLAVWNVANAPGVGTSTTLTTTGQVTF